MRINLRPPPWATHLISDLDDWMKSPRPVADVTPFDLPDDAYFEYAWLDDEGRKRPDPTNPNPPHNPWWDYARWLAGPKYQQNPFWLAAKDTLHGKVTRLRLPSKILGDTRHILIYTPPGTGTDALPQVWFQDGKAYFGWGKAPQLYEALLAANLVAPARLIFLTPANRTQEYFFNPDYLRFVIDEAIPAIETAAPTTDARTAWGASLGGLCSANLAWQHPLKFATVVAQSGAFLFYPDQQLDTPFTGQEFWRNRVLTESWRPLRFHLSTGTLEWLHGPNRNLAQALTEREFPVEYIERPAGHNWTNWRDGLAAGFRFALPPQLK